MSSPSRRARPRTRRASAPTRTSRRRSGRVLPRAVRCRRCSVCQHPKPPPPPFPTRPLGIPPARLGSAGLLRGWLRTTCLRSKALTQSNRGAAIFEDLLRRPRPKPSRAGARRLGALRNEPGVHRRPRRLEISLGEREMDTLVGRLGGTELRGKHLLQGVALRA